MWYRLSEIFTIDEGGDPMTFIRFDPDGPLEYEEEGLAKRCIDQGNEWVCFCGERPIDLQPLRDELEKRGLEVL